MLLVNIGIVFVYCNSFMGLVKEGGEKNIQNAQKKQNKIRILVAFFENK